VAFSICLISIAIAIAIAISVAIEIVISQDAGEICGAFDRLTRERIGCHASHLTQAEPDRNCCTDSQLGLESYARKDPSRDQTS
jgi:hypothetical protein